MWACSGGGEAPAPRPKQAVVADAGGPSACIGEAPKTPVTLPWANAEMLCAQADRGQPWPGAVPPLGPDREVTADAYAERVQTFLRGLDYRRPPYAWLHDARWRLTGDYEGCPPDGIDKGPHPAVRIYYSPEVIDWMCKYRQGEAQLPSPDAMPDGAMIIKEMISVGSVNLKRVPGTDHLWIAPPEGDDARPYDEAFSSWTVMIKASGGAADGWYQAYFGRTGEGNPPLWDRAAFSAKPYPGSDGQPVTAPPGNAWYPTSWQYSVPDGQFPNAEFGNYCVYCHASAQGQNTFASFKNLLGTEIEYAWRPEKSLPVDFEDHHGRKGPAQKVAADADPRAPFPSPLPAPWPSFRRTYTALDPPYADVWASRLPAESWDHAVSLLGVDGQPDRRSQFLTSDQCEGCHSGGGRGQLKLPNMLVEVDGTQMDLTPWAEWGASPMGLAGRDPIFHAQLELERNIGRSQPGLANILDCIDNTCLHCHGAPGARQYNIDTVGEGPADDPCAAFLPPKSERVATDYDGKLFTQEMVFAWRDERPDLARYGGLARDGINCTVCHHIADKALDPANLPRTFTGNYRVGPPNEIFGPFPNPQSKEDVLPAPMRNALAITPRYGEQIAQSELCGTCHTVFLPVFDDTGALAGTAYEQTTYLEWLLSDFAAQGGQSCQECHLGDTYGEQQHPLRTGIANVQNTRYPKADFLLPAKDVDNPDRPYRRHQLYGLNAFLNAFFQQFPLLLGIRQQDYMNASVRAPLLTGRETVLDVARRQTADVQVGAPAWQEGTLVIPVTVVNKSGHALPSGVGFRRLFIELLVLDADDQPIWASGRTNDMGVLLAGLTETPLPTETWQAGADGLPFQPHYQRITGDDQVQIYEEINQSQALTFTSSFIHRYWLIKDNRLRPRGWNPGRVSDPKRQIEYGAATEPGTGPDRAWWPKPAPMAYANPTFPAIDGYHDTKGDPDYTLADHATTGLPGTDAVTYAIALPPETRARASRVQATLYSQSIPPHYLEERFAMAAKPGSQRQSADRLYHLVGHLDTLAKADDGAPFLANWRL
ncbi:MAG: hypothetical protein KC620_15540, partial [Myxococcales bacterium]|nr:hypothetical protein [Myxococcales bacterium]